jgi:multidrug efflux pump
MGVIQDAFVMVLPPPPVNGLGTIGGFKMMIEDRGNVGYDELYKAMQAMQMQGMAGQETGRRVLELPDQRAAAVRRRRPLKAKQLGVPLQTIYQTLQINLGSLYVNDFNQFGRTYQVRVQADAPFRSHAEDIAQLKVRNDKGEMIPLSSLMRVKDSYGPDRVQRYNAYVRPTSTAAPPRACRPARPRPRWKRSCNEVLPKGDRLRMDRPDLPGHPVR